jgi:SAM-dependent methyltransferase
MYDAFSQDYDRFMNWDERLKAELPFIEAQLQTVKTETRPLRVLDAACGTGMHAIALAQKGYAMAGADLSAGMIVKARENAAAAGVEARFETAGFGSLAGAFGPEAFDALLCLGNSLPHTLTVEELATTLRDFAACLRPGGLLLVQNRNFDAVLESRERWMEPQAHREGNVERIFLRFYDYEPTELVTFNLVTLRREAGGAWTQAVRSSRLRPLRQAELLEALSKTGFGSSETYGSMTAAPFLPASSPNLVVTARRGEE